MSLPSWSFYGARRWAWAGVVLLVFAGLGRGALWGQGTVQDDGGNEKSAAPLPQVIVRREAVQLLPPDGYRIRLSLESARAVELVAPSDGIVRVISAREGEAVREKTEVIRLDDTRQQLMVRRAKARLKAAQAEKAQADGARLAILEARVDEAEAEVALATYDAEEAVVRTPFGGTLERLRVVEGEFVKAGQKLARLVDSRQLQVEAPVDRSLIQVGGQMEIQVEGSAVVAKVLALLPLEERFAAVSQLVESPAQAVLLIENETGKLRPGQTVQSLLLPRDPVTAVSVAAVGNQPDGTRRVQVLRDGVVRNLPVQVHGRAGGDAVFVSGRFGATDEVIVATTRELADGTPLRALAGTETAAGAKPGAEAGKKKKPNTTNSGF
ncbi:MAG: efflux RND transporter periplasmic adaptor subunit [Planctomycetaceae bacterium]